MMEIEKVKHNLDVIEGAFKSQNNIKNGTRVLIDNFENQNEFGFKSEIAINHRAINEITKLCTNVIDAYNDRLVSRQDLVIYYSKDPIYRETFILLQKIKNEWIVKDGTINSDKIRVLLPISFKIDEELILPCKALLEYAKSILKVCQKIEFDSFGQMANYLFNHKLMIFESDMFVDPKTIKFQFECWERIIQYDFDKWLLETKEFQRSAGVPFDGYLTMNNMYDFAKWYNESKLLQERNNKKFSEMQLKKVGLLNENTQTPEFDTNDKTNPLTYDKSMFDNLPDSNLPVIDKDIIKPEFILGKYLNKAFECSPFAFYAWLVYGKKYEKEQIKWTFKKENRDTISKAQLKLFIDKITNTDKAKIAYFKKVFNVEIKKSDYRNSFNLDNYFKELTDEIVKNKTKKK